jgi:hypothetical protein
MNVLIFCYRQIFCCKRRIQKLFDIDYRSECIPKHKFPWMWIGADINGCSQNYTALVNENVMYGVPVNSKFLSEVTGCNPDRWLYLDSRTLHQLEIPPEGFIIRQ